MAIEDPPHRPPDEDWYHYEEGLTFWDHFVVPLFWVGLGFSLGLIFCKCP